MRKYSTVSFLLIVLATLWSCQKATTPDSINEPFQSEQENIKSLINEIFNVARAKDMDSLDSYHLNSPKFSKFDDGEISGRQDYEMGKKTENEFFAGVTQFDFTLPDTKVDVFDDVAIASFILDYTVLFNGATIAGKSRGTLVFVKADKRWKIAHEHFSPVLQAEQ